MGKIGINRLSRLGWYVMAQQNRWWPLTSIESICVLIISLALIGSMVYFRAPVLNEEGRYKSEPKVIIGSIERGQIAYFLTEQGFTSDITDLDLDKAFPDETINYIYRTQALSDVAVQSVAIVKDPTLHVSYIGLLLLGQGSNNETVTRRLWCESRKKIDRELPSFSLPDNINIETVKCPKGYRPIWNAIRPFP